MHILLLADALLAVTHSCVHPCVLSDELGAVLALVIIRLTYWDDHSGILVPDARSYIFVVGGTVMACQNGILLSQTA